MSTVKKPETKVEAKAADKVEAVKVTAKKAEAPKAAVKKAEPAKKTAAKKAPAKKAEKATEEVYIEFNSAKVSTADIVAKVVEATGKKASSIKVLNVYIQPETGKTYYTADGVSGEIEYLFQ